jgi:hypothetical protein
LRYTLYASVPLREATAIAGLVAVMPLTPPRTAVSWCRPPPLTRVR